MEEWKNGNKVKTFSELYSETAHRSRPSTHSSRMYTHFPLCPNNLTLLHIDATLKHLNGSPCVESNKARDQTSVTGTMTKRQPFGSGRTQASDGISRPCFKSYVNGYIHANKKTLKYFLHLHKFHKRM
jgi:hypothetical protein